VTSRLRRSRLVKEHDRGRLRQLLTLFGLCAGATALFLFSLWQRVELTALQYRIMELRTERDALEEARRGLRLERLQLRSLPRVEKVARERLGLAPALPRQIYTAGVSGDLAIAGAQPAPGRPQR
jgi:cell division protein FtsL